MSKSYQQEIPPARVNITLDVETGQSTRKKELPMKLLMLGDYSHGQSQAPISDRARLQINRQNFNQTLESISPTVQMQVANKVSPAQGDLNVSLSFKNLNDFSPDIIAKEVPVLQKLVAMRNLLKELKSCIIDNQTFRKKLESILKNHESIKQFRHELDEKAPLSD